MKIFSFQYDGGTHRGQVRNILVEGMNEDGKSFTGKDLVNGGVKRFNMDKVRDLKEADVLLEARGPNVKNQKHGLGNVVGACAVLVNTVDGALYFMSQPRQIIQRPSKVILRFYTQKYGGITYDVGNDIITADNGGYLSPQQKLELRKQAKEILK